MDFTLSKYHSLLTTLQKQGFLFFPAEALTKEDSLQKSIILRHDVDLLPANSLHTAQIENSLHIQGTYYFRIIPQGNQAETIKKITNLGHEIGYHYEDLTLTNGNMEKAWDSFRRNLDYFRQFYPVKTICMHGSPRSKFDSKDLWKKYDYRSLGIIGEPYLDLDFNEWFYLTDTGRRWDGWKTSVRDKMPQQEKWIKEGLVFHSTDDIIRAAGEDRLPSKIMITVHPQRWTNRPLPWAKELIIQSVKNQIKRFFYVK